MIQQLILYKQLSNMHTFYFIIEENRDGQFGAQNCKLNWADKLVNQTLLSTNKIIILIR